MKTSVKMLDDIEVQVEVEIPALDVDKEYQRQLGKLRKQARIKGFRPGKAPRSIVKRIYGAQIASEASRQLIGNTMSDALEKTGKTPVGEPSIEPSLAQEGEPMTYTIRVQVKPEFQVVDWREIEVSAPSTSVASEAIDADLERRRISNAERVPIEGRAADIGDFLVLDLLGRVDGKADERLKTPGLEVKIGSGTLIPGFEDQLVGVIQGENRTVEVTFPQEYHAEDLAGKAVSFDCDVTGLFSEEVPDLDDDFAMDIGFDNVAALRADVEGQLSKEYERQRRQVLEDKVVEIVMERNTFTTPTAMVQMQMDAQVRRMMSLFRAQGMGAQEAMKMIEGESQDITSGAERAVRRYLLLDRFATQEKIEIDDDALNAEILQRVQRAGAYGGQLFENEEQKEGLRLEMRESAALDLIIEHAKISDAKDSESVQSDELKASETSDPEATNETENDESAE
jgi:trigger factor